MIAPGDVSLVAAAPADARVVRVKGGDPAIFARSKEEIDALAGVGIRARICVGITARQERSGTAQS